MTLVGTVHQNKQHKAADIHKCPSEQKYGGCCRTLNSPNHK